MLAIITSHPIQYQAPLWRALARDGRVPFEVWFLTPHAVLPAYDPEFGKSFAWDVDLLEGYPHRFLDVQPNWRLDSFGGIRMQRDWATELRVHGVTSIWLEGWRFSTLWKAAASAHHAGIQVWLRGESHDLGPEAWSRRLWKRFALGWLFRRVDHFLSIGSANHRFYLNHGVAESKLADAPYCVDNEHFARIAADLRQRREEFRHRWSIADEAYCVLFCGKLISKKRPLDLLAAAQLSPELAGRPVHLLFAGDGELARQVREALIATPTLHGNVTGFLNQTEIPTVFAAADCLVLPSDYGETWGLVVNEALASGLPVIVSDRCGCATDLAAPLGKAHVFPCGDVRALADSLQRVAHHPPSPDVMRVLVEKYNPLRTVENVAILWSHRPSS